MMVSQLRTSVRWGLTIYSQNQQRNPVLKAIKGIRASNIITIRIYCMFSVLLMSIITLIYLHRLATPFKCEDREFRDVSPPPVPRGSSQFLSSGQKNTIFVALHSGQIIQSYFFLLRGWKSVYLPDCLGKRHHSTPCGSKGRSNSTGWVASGVRCRPRCTRHKRTHPYGLRQVWTVLLVSRPNIEVMLTLHHPVIGGNVNLVCNPDYYYYCLPSLKILEAAHAIFTQEHLPRKLKPE